MNNEQIILIGFRLLNFGALIAIVLYLWKKYGRDYIAAEHEAEKEHLRQLALNHAQLRKQEEQIQNAYANDEKKRIALRERLFMWREVVQKKRDKLAAEKEERMRALDDIAEKQIQQVTEYRICRNMKQEALEQARKSLQKEFEAKEKQAQVIATIVKRLESA